MFPFPFTITTTSSQPIKAKGDFIRYRESTAGADPTIKVKTDRGDVLVMDPGEKYKLPHRCESWEVTNDAGLNSIAGTLVIGEGDADSASVTGTVTTSTNASPTGAAHTSASVTVGAAAANALAANTNRKYLSVQNQSATENIFARADGTAAVANGTSFRIPPGGVWTPRVAPTGAVSLIRGGGVDVTANVIEA